MPRFIYVMDPMCSWCWAFNTSISALKHKYPHFNWTYLMGGLAPDSDETMAEEMQLKLQSIWQHIEQATGTTFNHDFWSANTPRRSTYPACRAVIAAEQLMPGAGEKMITRIQESYYLKAKNPSNDDLLIDLAQDIKLDKDLFREKLRHPDTQLELEQQIKQGYTLGAQGFPSLFIESNGDISALSYGYCDKDTLEGRVEKAVTTIDSND
jgi:putative protein-disulfide isomerase